MSGINGCSVRCFRSIDPIAVCGVSVCILSCGAVGDVLFAVAAALQVVVSAAGLGRGFRGEGRKRFLLGASVLCQAYASVIDFRRLIAKEEGLKVGYSKALAIVMSEYGSDVKGRSSLILYKFAVQLALLSRVVMFVSCSFLFAKLILNPSDRKKDEVMLVAVGSILFSLSQLLDYIIDLERIEKKYLRYDEK
jgi:hypothetical protein